MRQEVKYRCTKRATKTQTTMQWIRYTASMVLSTLWVKRLRWVLEETTSVHISHKDLPKGNPQHLRAHHVRSLKFRRWKATHAKIVDTFRVNWCVLLFVPIHTKTRCLALKVSVQIGGTKKKYDTTSATLPFVKSSTRIASGEEILSASTQNVFERDHKVAGTRGLKLQPADLCRHVPETFCMITNSLSFWKKELDFCWKYRNFIMKDFFASNFVCFVAAVIYLLFQFTKVLSFP